MMATITKKPRPQDWKRPEKRDRYVTYDRHLNSPLTQSEIEFYYNNPKWAGIDHPEIPHSAFQDLRTGFVNNINVLRNVELSIRQSCTTGFRQSHLALERSIQLAVQSLNIQSEALYYKMENFDSTRFNTMKARISSSAQLRASVVHKVFILQIHQALHEGSLTNEWSFSIPCLPQIEFHGSLVLIKNFPGKPIVITYNMLLGVMDKIEATFHFQLYATAVEASPKFSSLGYLSLATQLHEILEDAYTQLGVAAAGLYKALEPICCGVILEDLDGNTNYTEFLTVLMDNMERSKPEVHPWAAKVVNLFQHWIRLYGDRAHPAIFDCYGQEKLHFFPIVDDELGLLKMYRYGTSTRSSDPRVATILRGTLTRDYTISYYAKEHRLPPIWPVATNDPRLLKIWESGVLPAANLCQLISTDAWADLTLLKHHEFDYSPDPLDLMDDKACAPDRSNLNQLYPVSVRKAYGLPPPPSQSIRRLVQYMLENPEIDIRELFKKALQLGGIPYEWTLILLSMKERENKPDGRAYSVLHPLLRMITSSLEKNISNSILRYFPQQTMTYSGSELASTVSGIAGARSTNETVHAHFHLDIEQWNYTFRERVTCRVQHWMNEVFGVENYYLLMRPFKDALFVINDAFTPICQPDRFTNWHNYPGGNQGICQKFWTLITLLTIAMAIVLTGFHYYLMGAGDNQVPTVSIPRSTTTRNDCLRIKQLLEQAFRSIGLIVKLEETWYSDRLLAYQRCYWMDGQPLPLGCKSCLRFGSGNNEGADSVTMHTTTSMAAGAAMTSGMSDPALGPCLALIEWYLGLLTTPRWMEHLPISDDEMVALSWVNSSLGYLPVQPLSFFQYSGHRDMFCETLAMLNTIMELHPKYRVPISQLLAITPRAVDQESKLQLVLDPFSPNVSRPVTAETHIKKEVLKFLTTNAKIKNARIQQMLQLLQDHHQYAMADSLLAITPLNTSIVHALFDYSQVGHVASMVNKFTKISSIVKMTDNNRVQQKEVPFSQVVRDKDIGLLKQIAGVFRRKVVAHPIAARALLHTNWTGYMRWCALHALLPECTFSARLYVMVWTHGLGDDYLFGPYCPAPSEQLIFEPEGDLSSLDESILVSPATSIPDTLAEMETTRGPFDLYIGSSTQEPIRGLKYLNLSGVENGTAVRVLAKIYAWMNKCKSSDSIMEFLGAQVDSRLIGLSELLRLTSRRAAGGHIGHRLQIPGDVTGAYLSTQSLVSSWYSITTNRATTLQRGEDDRYLFFQAAYQHIFAVLRWHQPLKKKFRVRVRMDHCSYLIPDQQFDMPPGRTIPTVSQMLSFTLPDSTTELVRSALIHEIWVRDLGLGDAKTQEDGIAAHLAHSVAASLARYQGGTAKVDIRGSPLGFPQPSLNLTLVRAVSTPALLQAILLAFAYRGTLGGLRSPLGFYRRLSVISSTPTTLQDIAAHSDILEALAVTGKMQDVAIIANLTPRWASKDGDHGSLRLYFKALLVTMEALLHQPSQVSLIVEMDRWGQSSRRLHKFLRGWSEVYKRWHYAHSTLPATDFLRNHSHTLEYVLPLVATSSEEVLERARSMGSTHTPAPALVPRPLTQLPPVASIGPSTFQPWGECSGHRSDHPTPGHIGDPSDTASNCPATVLPYEAFQMLRWSSIGSGGRLKLLEILARSSMTIPLDPSVVSLAEGSASMLSALLHMYPQARGVYNTLTALECLPQSAAGGLVPPDLACPCGVQSRVVNLPYLSGAHGDLNSDSTWDELFTAVSHAQLTSIILTWDKEGDTENDPSMLRKLRVFCEAVSPKLVVVKLFASTSPDQLIAQVKGLADLFHSFYLVKPFFSNPRSSEFYVVLGTSSWANQSPSGAQMRTWLKGVNEQCERTTCARFMRDFIHASRWSALVTPCSVVDQFTYSLPDSQVSGLLAGCLQTVAFLRHVIRSRDDTVTGMVRSFQHMADANTRGTQSTLADGWTKLMCLALLLQLAGYPDDPVPLQYAHDTVHLSASSLLTQAEQAMAHLALSSEQTRLWRMLGQALTLEETIPFRHSPPILAQLGHLVSKLTDTYFVGHLFDALPDVFVQYVQSIGKSLPDNYLSVLSDPAGREWVESALLQARTAHGPVVVSECFVFEWLHLLWASHEWPYRTHATRGWHLHVHQEDPLLLGCGQVSGSHGWIAWSSIECPHTVASTWTVVSTCTSTALHMTMAVRSL